MNRGGMNIGTIATVTSKGQITLPKRLCERYEITPGDKVSLEVVRGAIVRTPAKRPVEHAAGSLKQEAA